MIECFNDPMIQLRMPQRPNDLGTRRLNDPVIQRSWGCTMRTGALGALLLFCLGSGISLAQQPGGQGGQAGQGTTRTQPTTQTIRGRVYLPSAFPASSQLRVSLRTITQAVIQEAFTDSVGNFEFRNVSGGTYEVVVWETDDTEQSVERIEVESRVSRTFFANVFLKARPETESKTAGGVVSVHQLDPNVPKAARREYERGAKEAEKGAREKAISYFEKAVQLYPKYFQAFNDLGVQYSRVNRFADAETAFVKATELDPRAPFPYLNIGYMRIAQKQYQDAVEAFSRVTELDSMNWAGHLWLGVALMETSHYESSKSELETALALGKPPEASSARLYLANLFIRQGDLGKAIEQSELYLEESPKVANADEVRSKIAQMRSLMEKNRN